MKRLHFYGGASRVTGSCFLLELDDRKILIDCGMFQGDRFAEKDNHEAFPFDPSQISHVFITHAHADHIGRLPKLYKEGFRGKIIATPPTRDLTEVMLTDAIKVMHHEIEDRGGQMLYEAYDLRETMMLFDTHPYNTPITSIPGLTVTLRTSGHVLGSAMIEVEYDDKKITFTGDLGNTPSPLLNDIYPLKHTDYLLMESVYGNRLHEPTEERVLQLERIIEDTVTKGGTLIIPSFALERTQVLLTELNDLIEHNRVPKIPVFIDSPLAYNATKVYMNYLEYFKPAVQEKIKAGDNIFDFPGLTFTPSREESKTINNFHGPKIIIAGNPHGFGSRIAYHFKRYLPDPNSTVLFVGWQAGGSLGRRIVDGATTVNLFNESVPVRANIVTLSSYSGHADQKQLVAFLEKIDKPIKKIFVAMGEPDSAFELAQIIRDQFGMDAIIPKFSDIMSLE